MTNYNYPDFNSWFTEQESFATRQERFYSEYESSKQVASDKTLRRWLEAAFYAARIQQSYTLEVQGEGEDVFITLPEEVVKNFGWEEGTVVEWNKNLEGTSWTLKEKR